MQGDVIGGMLPGNAVGSGGEALHRKIVTAQGQIIEGNRNLAGKESRDLTDLTGQLD